MGPSSSEATSERGEEEHQRNDDLQPDHLFVGWVPWLGHWLPPGWYVLQQPPRGWFLDPGLDLRLYEGGGARSRQGKVSREG